MEENTENTPLDTTPPDETPEGEESGDEETGGEETGSEGNDGEETGDEENGGEGSGGEENADGDHPTGGGTPGETGTEENTVDYAVLAAADLTELRTAFATLRKLRSLCELENLQRYAELRELGLSAAEAYAASHYESMIRPPVMPDGRAHLSPTLGRSAVPSHAGMSAGALSSARELFPSLSDREIEALYLRASGKRNK